MSYKPNNLMVLRKQKELSQEELADKVGVSQPRISYIESGQDDSPPKELLVKISEILGYIGDPFDLLQAYAG